MLVMSICSVPEVLEVMRIINMVILIIKIVVPILLILTGMITLMKTINVGNDDLLAKAKKQLVSNCIAAIVIFLIPTLVNVIVKVSDTDNQYRDCLYADTEIINNAYSNKAETLVSTAESSKTYNDYYAAKDAVSKIKDGNERASLEERLDALYEIIKSDIDKNNDGETNNGTGGGTNTDNNSGNTVGGGEVKNISGTIYMGDSRTNGLKLYGGLSSDEQVFATDGGGYNSFLGHITSVNNVLSNGKSYNIVLNYGVNDLGNSSKYCEKYKSFINSVNSKNNVYVMSVNPVNDSGSEYAKNSSIETFNSSIKSCISGLKNVKYCDVYGSTSINEWTSKYISSDAIHYNSDGYKYIHSKIKSCIG